MVLQDVEGGEIKVVLQDVEGGEIEVVPHLHTHRHTCRHI